MRDFVIFNERKRKNKIYLCFVMMQLYIKFRNFYFF